MARGTQEQEQTAEVVGDFPYAKYQSHPAWATLVRAIDELQSNSDLELQTSSRYVVGYLMKALEKKSLLIDEIAPRPTAPAKPLPRASRRNGKNGHAN
jgi:hypothetical protein